MTPLTDTDADDADHGDASGARDDAHSDPDGAAADAGDAPALVGDDLVLAYGDDDPVVECDHVVVPAGEITALVGPNGSGKSTLLKALAGQLDPRAGRVEVDGRPVGALGDAERARTVGLLAQEHDAPRTLAVEDLVDHGRYPYRGFLESPDEADHAAVDRALDLAGVTDLRDEALGELSGGQKQLAWVAMVLAQDPDVLLLDEPTTYLDLEHQLRVMEVVRDLTAERNVTVAVVLHDVAQAARYADNLVAMRDGELYDWGPPRKVVTEALLADVFGVAATVDSDAPTGPHVRPHHPLDAGDARGK